MIGPFLQRFRETTELVWATAQDRAAPAGGALKRGRGCPIFAVSAVCVMMIALSVPTKAEPLAQVETRSGLQAQFIETVQDKSSYGLTLHFRFVVPQIAVAEVAFEQVSLDMEELCTGFALPRLPVIGPQPRQIVISLSSAETPFGVANPDVTQFFEAFSVQDGRCIWEVF